MTFYQQRLSRFFLLLVLIAAIPATATAQLFTVLSFDPKGDVRAPSTPDAAQLAFHYDKEKDTLWFRIAVYGKANADSLALNLLFDTGSDDAGKMNWWGINKSFRFDRIVTANVRRAAGTYQGTIGVGDVAGVKSKQLTNLRQNNLQIKVEDDSIVIGVKRSDITDKPTMKLVASIGSNQEWTDDVPNAGSAAIDLSKLTPGVRELDVSRNNLELPKGLQTIPNNKRPVISRRGRGRQALILIPGMYSGNRSFDSFIARNESQYKIFLMIPPGLNGTAPRAAPPVTTSFSELTWTRRLEDDILELIHKEKLTKPVLVAERQPAAQAAVEVAVEHPDRVGGVVLVGTNLVQFFASPKDPTRKTPIGFVDRGPFVDESWVGKWFKYVTPETWKNGDVGKQLLSTDPARAQSAWDELEAAPLEVKIRYLCEFWASDVTRDFDRLKVPMLALVPGFDEKFLAEPANAFAKPSFLDVWETLVPKHPLLELVKIPSARMLVLDDQPRAADAAIARFVKKLQ